MYEVYSPPITTLYSQVWWAPLAPVNFPQKMIQKYSNRSMAIVGWEIDQVIRGNSSEYDVSVPINANYNHHYTASVIGGEASFQKVRLTGPSDPLVKKLRKQGHGRIAIDQPQYIVKDGTETTHIPFSSANGGEYRKTFHGFAPSYVLRLDSPKQVQITPMQIDTFNRDEMKFENKLTKFVPGPLPRASQAPKDASYSGLLECPMTTRLERVVDTSYFLSDISCSQNETIQNMEECVKAVSDILKDQHVVLSSNRTVNTTALPQGCSARMSNESVEVFLNKMKDSFAVYDDDTQVLGHTSALGVGLSVRVGLKVTNITLSGPENVWFGIGFDAQNMGNLPYTIVVDGTGEVTERKLGNHEAGTLLKPSVTIISNSVENNQRTVVMTRSNRGVFNFTNVSKVLDVIIAVGSTSTFGYHKFRSPAKLTFFSSRSTCVCSKPPPSFGQATGSLVYHANASQIVDVGTGSVAFGANKCRPWPFSQLLDFANPTCDVR